LVYKEANHDQNTYSPPSPITQM